MIVTPWDLVTLFRQTKSVTKSRFDCNSIYIRPISFLENQIRDIHGKSLELDEKKLSKAIESFIFDHKSTTQFSV